MAEKFITIPTADLDGDNLPTTLTNAILHGTTSLSGLTNDTAYRAFVLANPSGVFTPELGLDPDAAAYITAVETADGEALEEAVKTAINDFVVGCKADSIWAALKASCILAGARTLSGALVPLVGTAPTNVNFVSGDYNRKTGLIGNGSTKYLDSNRANNADPQNNNHHAIWITEANTNDPAILMGDGAGTTVGNNRLVFASAGSINLHFDNRSGESGSVTIGATNPTGLLAHSRSASASASARVSGTTTSHSMPSSSPTTTNVHVFARESGGVPTNARLSFYSIGENIDLAALDARVSALMTALDGAIA